MYLDGHSLATVAESSAKPESQSGHGITPRSTCVSSRSPGEECVAVHLVSACLVLTGCTGECVYWWSDLDLGETGFFEHLLPARTGQPAGNSAGPEIDVS